MTTRLTTSGSCVWVFRRGTVTEEAARAGEVETCGSCHRAVHIMCHGGPLVRGLCKWCERRGDLDPPRKEDRFTVEMLPRRVRAIEDSVRPALPLLPQAVISMPEFRYKDARRKNLVGKGPKETEVSFIMMLPWMLRDVRSQAFLDMMQCKQGSRAFAVQTWASLISVCIVLYRATAR